MPAKDMERTYQVVSLCDRTGTMLLPWASAGYDCLAVDLQHDGTTTEAVGDGTITYAEGDVTEFDVPAGDYVAAFAFPPCTDLAVSGARWMQEKGLQALARAIETVGACHDAVSELGCPWMVENPVSTLSTYWRDPDWKFNPYQFQGYTDRDEAYTKETWLWTGGGFRMPRPDSGGVTAETADDRIHKAPPTDDRADKRAATPHGFAVAVYLAHQNPDRYAVAAADGREQADLTELIA